MTTLEIFLTAALTTQVIAGAIVGHFRYRRDQLRRESSVEHTRVKHIPWAKGRRDGKTDRIQVVSSIAVTGTNIELNREVLRRFMDNRDWERTVDDNIDNSIEFYLLKS